MGVKRGVLVSIHHGMAGARKALIYSVLPWQDAPGSGSGHPVAGRSCAASRFPDGHSAWWGRLYKTSCLDRASIRRPGESPPVAACPSGASPDCPATGRPGPWVVLTVFVPSFVHEKANAGVGGSAVRGADRSHQATRRAPRSGGLTGPVSAPDSGPPRWCPCSRLPTPDIPPIREDPLA